jgi:hypothetical protein
MVEKGRKEQKRIKLSIIKTDLGEAFQSSKFAKGDG